MNRFTATNTAPVTQNVRLTVSSIVSQFDAIGVNHHGLRKWNATVPITSSTTAIAIAMCYSFCRSRSSGEPGCAFALRRTERVDEVAVDARELCFRVPLAHHPGDSRFLLLQRIDQDQELAGLDVVVKLRELAVLVADADQAAFPRAEQRRYADDGVVDEVRNLDAERVEVLDQADADQADQETHDAANDAIADDIERLEIVAGVDVLLLQPRFVTRDDVHEEILDPDLMQVVRDPMGALQRRRQIVQALHRFTPPLQNFRNRTPGVLAPGHPPIKKMRRG